MLKNSKGATVTLPRGAKEEELIPLREQLDPAQKHCGKLFRLETRAKEKQVQKC